MLTAFVAGEASGAAAAGLCRQYIADVARTTAIIAVAVVLEWQCHLEWIIRQSRFTCVIVNRRRHNAGVGVMFFLCGYCVLLHSVAEMRLNRVLLLQKRAGAHLET